MGKSAVIFTGQGAQHVGMGRDVCEASTAAREVFDRAGHILGRNIADVCFHGPAEELARTDIQQPAIFVTSVAIWEALRERGRHDGLLDGAAGLSLGEYTALYAAGSMSFADGLKLVARRGQLMQEAAAAQPSGMVTLIGADEERARALCAEASTAGVLVPANFNCPGQVVLSGAKTACARARELADKYACRAVALNVVGAFHSPFMEPAAAALGGALTEADIRPPRVPVYANVDANPHDDDPDRIRGSLRAQLTEPVLWARGVERMIEDGFDFFVEIGPGRVLSGLMRKINRQVPTANVRDAAGLDADLHRGRPGATASRPTPSSSAAR